MGRKGNLSKARQNFRLGQSVWCPATDQLFQVTIIKPDKASDALNILGNSSPKRYLLYQGQEATYRRRTLKRQHRINFRQYQGLPDYADD